MDRIKIKAAKKKDVPRILELTLKLAEYHRGLDKYYKYDSKTRRFFKKFLLDNISKKRGRVLIAEVEDELIGYLVGIIERTKPLLLPQKIGKVTDAFIEEKYRRFGVGSGMLQDLVDWYKKNKVNDIFVSVHIKNIIGINFWEKLGFENFTKSMRIRLKNKRKR